MTGRYYSGSNYLILSDSSIEFKYNNVYGFGPYKIKQDKIVVRTVTKIHKYSSKYVIDSIIDSKDKFRVSIFNPQDILPWMTFISVKKAKHRKDNSFIMVENSNPVLVEIFNSSDSEDKVVIFNNVYDKLVIPLNDILGRSIKVYMTDNTTLMDEKVTFKIIKNPNETIITGPFFKLSKQEKKLYGLNHTWPWKRKSHCHHEIVPIEYRKENWR